MKLVSKTQINEFVSLIWQGVEAWVKAGEMFVRLLDLDPDLYSKITAAHPQISAGTLARFEQLGRKAIDPRLLLCECPGYDRLEHLPLSQQALHIEQPVPVFELSEDGKEDHRLVPVSKLTMAQARQVFTPTRVRSVAEQKHFVRDAAQRKAVTRAVPAPDYTVKGKRVTFTRGTTLTAGQLTSILHEIVG